MKASLKKQRQQITELPPASENRILPLLGEEESALVDVEAAPAPSDGDLTKIRKLGELQIEIMTRIAKGEAVLARLNEYLKDVTERQLPLVLKEVQMRDFTLMDGSRVVLEEFVAAGIKKANKPKAYAWLEETGRGDLIKHVITISFGKGEDAWARKFMADLEKRKKKVAAERKDDVNFQTLNAFVREQVAMLRAKGVDPYLPPDAKKNPHGQLPKELLGIYEGSRAAAQLSPVAVERIRQAVERVTQQTLEARKNSAS
jgi:hypothetical protein